MSFTVHCGDALTVLRTLPADSVDCCVTSPPYFGLRAYLPEGHPDKHLELGCERTPEEFVANLVAVFPSWEQRKQLGEGNLRGFAQNAPAGCHRVGGGLTRNRRDVWTLGPSPTPEMHFATFGIELAETCILAGTPEGGSVLDPFCGAGTSGIAALKHGREFVGVELNPAYVDITRNRLVGKMPLLAQDFISEVPA